MLRKVNIKNLRLCAFCKYWYDPTNSYINPANPVANLWEYEASVKCKCLKRNLDTSSYANCAKYECKVPKN